MTDIERENIFNSTWAKDALKAKSVADKAYNKGLWDSVKWNPFKWCVYLAYVKRD